LNHMPRNRFVQWLSVAALAAGLALWIAYLIQGDSDARAWRAVLINFLYFTPLAAAMAVWPGIIRLSRGGWAKSIETPVLSFAGFAVPSLLALAALGLASSSWVPWWNPEVPHQGWWLYPPFVFGRDFAALLAFWVTALFYLKRPNPTRLVLTVLGYTLTFSLIGFDLAKALDPHFYSTLFGGYFFVSGLYAGMAGWAFLSAWFLRAEADRLHDLGRLTLAFSILTTYMMFSHILPIWYENLPEEVIFFIPRIHGDWLAVTIILAVMVYLGPLPSLLTIRAKRSRVLLGSITSVILVGLWIERLWLVQPHFEESPRIGLPELSMAAAFWGALYLSRMLAAGRLGAWRNEEEGVIGE